MPTLPPTTANPYTGAEVTANARASLQHALDNYKLGHINLSLRVGGDLSRSDTRSFGESHASELSSLASPSTGQDSHPGLSLTPPIPEPASTEKEDHSVQPPSVNPDQSAPPIPAQPVPVVTPTGTSPGSSPVGPLHDIPASDSGVPAESPSEDLYGTAPPKTESAEEEKQRLGREERERVLAASHEVDNQRVTGSESAEEEKKRLEREERERVLASGASVTKNTAEKDGEELPPYEDFQE